MTVSTRRVTPMNVSLSAVNVLLAARACTGQGSRLARPADALALVCHATMTVCGFRLLGLGEGREGRRVLISERDVCGMCDTNLLHVMRPVL